MQPSHPDADHPDSRDPAATDQPNPNLLRDRLANERTFLAWLRTGIAITGLGFVVARFDLFLRQMAALTESTGTPVTSTTVSLGVVLVLAGPVLVGLAALRFWQTERALTRNQPPSQQSASVLVLAVTGGALVAGIALALHLVTTLPD
jgi:putative membrane protein